MTAAITPRRTFLQRLAGAFILNPLSRQQGFSLAPRKPVYSPQRNALGAVRIVNTLQQRHFALHGRFAALKELMQSDITKQFLSTQGVQTIVPEVAADTGVLISGFTTSFHYAAGGKGYTIILADTSGVADSVSYKSDEGGVIYSGTMQTARVGDGFVGHPMVWDKTKAQALNGVRGVAARLLTIVFPVLHAEANCCETFGCGFCISSTPFCAEICMPAWCCNLGYADCAWCCQADPSCFCPNC